MSDFNRDEDASPERGRPNGVVADSSDSSSSLLRPSTPPNSLSDSHETPFLMSGALNSTSPTSSQPVEDAPRTPPGRILPFPLAVQDPSLSPIAVNGQMSPPVADPPRTPPERLLPSAQPAVGSPISLSAANAQTSSPMVDPPRASPWLNRVVPTIVVDSSIPLSAADAPTSSPEANTLSLTIHDDSSDPDGDPGPLFSPDRHLHNLRVYLSEQYDNGKPIAYCPEVYKPECDSKHVQRAIKRQTQEYFCDHLASLDRVILNLRAGKEAMLPGFDALICSVLEMTRIDSRRSLGEELGENVFGWSRASLVEPAGVPANLAQPNLKHSVSEGQLSNGRLRRQRDFNGLGVTRTLEEIQDQSGPVTGLGGS